MKTILSLLIIALIIGAAVWLANRPSKNVDVDVNRQIPEEPADRGNTLAPQAGLPAEVEATRQAIFKAAVDRNYDKLNALAGDPKGFKYSFGGEYEGGFVGYLKLEEENTGKNAFETIKDILPLPYDKQGNIYVWPAVFNKAASDWNDADIAQMQTFLTDEEIEGYRKFGAYADWRIGIRDDGKWVYFIAGD